MMKRTAEFLAAMPNLSLTGLSENWLLKECGNQHWLALAQCTGQDVPDFRGRGGAPIYAAFLGVVVRDAHLNRVCEHDRFVIETHFVAVGKARYFSRHRVMVTEAVGCVCDIDMMSTLVTRTEQGNNQSVVRTALVHHRMHHSEQPDTAYLLEAARQMTASARHHRSDVVCSQPERPESLETGARYRVWPCPHSDFNGADFLYFANFQQAADRAEWPMFGLSQHQLWLTTERRVSYYGNINLGDALDLECIHHEQTDGVLTHRLCVKRVSDGEKIADIVTRKAAANASSYRWASREQGIVAGESYA